jgi:hypothetical protein
MILLLLLGFSFFNEKSPYSVLSGLPAFAKLARVKLPPQASHPQNQVPVAYYLQELIRFCSADRYDTHSSDNTENT